MAHTGQSKRTWHISDTQGEHSTHKTVTATFWAWLAGKSQRNHSSCSLFAPNRTVPTSTGPNLANKSIILWDRGTELSHSGANLGITPCKVTPVILHGVVSPECEITPVILHGVVSPKQSQNALARNSFKLLYISSLGVVYRGTSPIRKHNPLGPYRRHMPKVLGGS